jgi:hypothetical protein
MHVYSYLINLLNYLLNFISLKLYVIIISKTYIPHKLLIVNFLIYDYYVYNFKNVVSITFNFIENN